jgi:hypothetical protein
MPLLEGPLQTIATAGTFPLHRVGHPPRTMGRFSEAQYLVLLSSMFAKGHGIEALCFFLALTRNSLLDLAVQFDLPTPHDRPRRGSGGARAWKQSDFTVLLDGWFNNWSAACIAQQLSRTRGSVWYQARRLGLPKRERRSLHWPVKAASEPLSNETRVKQRLPERWYVKGTDRVFELTSKRQGLEVDWARHPAALVDIGWRIWSGQRIRRIADDYGVSYRTITSQMGWLQAVAPKRKNLRDDFDRALGEANARTAGAILARCQTNSVFSYWKTKLKRLSRRDARNGIAAGLAY